MAREVRLPQLGQTMEEGTIVDCRVKVGDEVKKGDVIFEIETDKATLEMESPAEGFVKHILVELDQTLPVGAPILVLGGKDEQVPQSFIDSLKSSTTAAAAISATPVAEAAPAAEPTEVKPEPTAPAAKVKASPRAKKLAEQLCVDLETVTGTGPAGRITEQDVKEAAAAKPAEPAFYLTVKADVTDLVEFRARMNETSDVKIAYNDFIMKAVATGLEKFSIMTGQLAGDTIKLAEAIHVGLAIAVPGGLVAPIVKDVNKKNVTQLARDSQALIERALSNKLAPTDLEGGCITVSNLGALGVESFIPIVVPGQCSILGIGKITDTCVPDIGRDPASREPNILVRKLMSMTLSVDHKVTNGAYAAQFLDFVRKLLEDPSQIANS